MVDLRFYLRIRSKYLAFRTLLQTWRGDYGDSSTFALMAMCVDGSYSVVESEMGIPFDSLIYFMSASDYA